MKIKSLTVMLMESPQTLITLDELYRTILAAFFFLSQSKTSAEFPSALVVSR